MVINSILNKLDLNGLFYMNTSQLSLETPQLYQYSVLCTTFSKEKVYSE